MVVDDFAGFAVLAALTDTICIEDTLPGAVYKPLDDILPSCGLIVHVTAELADPLTVAVNCCWFPCNTVTAAGETATDVTVTEGVDGGGGGGGAIREMVALADLVVSCMLVAVMVMFWFCEMLPGA